MDNSSFMEVDITGTDVDYLVDAHHDPDPFCLKNKKKMISSFNADDSGFMEVDATDTDVDFLVDAHNDPNDLYLDSCYGL